MCGTPLPIKENQLLPFPWTAYLVTSHCHAMMDSVFISHACSSMGRESMPSIASGELGSLGTSGRRVGSLNLAETAAARASTTSLVNELLQELHTHRVGSKKNAVPFVKILHTSS